MQCARQCRHKTDEEVVARRPLRGPLLTSLPPPRYPSIVSSQGQKKKRKAASPADPRAPPRSLLHHAARSNNKRCNGVAPPPCVYPLHLVKDAAAVDDAAKHHMLAVQPGRLGRGWQGKGGGGAREARSPRAKSSRG